MTISSFGMRASKSTWNTLHDQIQAYFSSTLGILDQKFKKGLDRMAMDAYSETLRYMVNLQALFDIPERKVTDFSSFLRCYRSFPFAVPTFVPLISHIQTFRKVLRCGDANLCRTSCQYQSSTGSPLREEVLKIGFA